MAKIAFTAGLAPMELTLAGVSSTKLLSRTFCSVSSGTLVVVWHVSWTIFNVVWNSFNVTYGTGQQCKRKKSFWSCGESLRRTPPVKFSITYTLGGSQQNGRHTQYNGRRWMHFLVVIGSLNAGEMNLTNCSACQFISGCTAPWGRMRPGNNCMLAVHANHLRPFTNSLRAKWIECNNLCHHSMHRITVWAGHFSIWRDSILRFCGFVLIKLLL